MPNRRDEKKKKVQVQQSKRLRAIRAANLRNYALCWSYVSILLASIYEKQNKQYNSSARRWLVLINIANITSAFRFGATAHS